jgi:glutamyl/glutaminyl-tRNA synthetase
MNTDGWLAIVRDAVVPSVDLATQVPGALEKVLAFPLDDPSEIQDTLDDPGAIDLIRRFAVELNERAQLTFEDFRAISAKLKDATKRKGKQLFHPLRAALTAKSSGPELDKLIPLIENAAQFGIKNVWSCRQRVHAFLERYG